MVGLLLLHQTSQFLYKLHVLLVDVAVMTGVAVLCLVCHDRIKLHERLTSVMTGMAVFCLVCHDRAAGTDCDISKSMSILSMPLDLQKTMSTRANNMVEIN